MSIFTPSELEYLTGERHLGRLATVGPDGMPHVTPVGWSLTDDLSAIEVSGRDFARTKKYRDVLRHGKAAIVIDDVLPPWRPRGIEIRGVARAIDDGHPRIRIRPTRIVSWELGESGGRSARTLAWNADPPLSAERLPGE
jgi:pyridoxamine 5'-phosphate oxidase family protein